MTIHEKTLEYLYKEQRSAKHAYGQAEYRPGVTMEELENLRWKIQAIDYCIALVLAASHETPLPVEIIKRALVEVKELCAHTRCVACPLHKPEAGSSIPYCPLYEDKYGEATQFPNMWEIDDWKDDSDDTGTA